MREGLIPHKVTTILRLSTTQARARALTEALAEVFDPESSAVAAFEQQDGSWLLEVYFAEEPDQNAVRDLVGLIAGREAARSVSFAALAAKGLGRSEPRRAEAHSRGALRGARRA